MSSTQAREGEAVQKVGVARRLDDFLYDILRPNVQVVSQRGKKPEKLPINPRSDEIRYDIENAQVYCDDG